MRRNYKLLISILILCFISQIFITLTTTSFGQTPIESGISFKEFLDDRAADGNFTSYDPGQIIEVEDEIAYIHYDEDDDITQIWLLSTGTSVADVVSPNLNFKSNLEKDFKASEKININFKIVLDKSGFEIYDYDAADISHITIIKEEEEKHGIDILGFHAEFPEQLEILDNNYGRFLIQFLLWVIIGIMVVLILDPVIRRATKKTETKIDDIILDIIRRPILILIILYGVVVSLRELELPKEFMYWVEGAYSIGFFLMMIWIGFRVFQGIIIQVGHTLTKRTGYRVDKILVPFIQKLGMVIVAIIVIMTVLGYLQIDLTLFAVGGVVVSMVIAFAAQDTLSNFFAGMFLILEPKFKEGDMIFFENDTYVVQKIGMRTTQLYDLFKHIDVVMPNNKLANEKLINITEPDRRIKDNVQIGVAYGTDPRKVQKILLDIVKNHPDIITDDPDRAPFTRFSEFADSSMNFTVGFWVRDLDNRFKAKSEINEQIFYKFAKEGIEIPFPQRDIHIISNESNSNEKKVLKYSDKKLSMKNRIRKLKMK